MLIINLVKLILVLGVVYGIVKSGIGIVVMSVMCLELIMKFIILVVMVGIFVIYGFVVVVFVGNGSKCLWWVNC